MPGSKPERAGSIHRSAAEGTDCAALTRPTLFTRGAYIPGSTAGLPRRCAHSPGPAACRRAHLPNFTAEPASYPLKRAFDLVGSGFALLLLGPLMLVVALAIWVLDPGPVIFSQNRIGRSGRPFRILKFRTMYLHGDELLARKLESDPASSAEWLSRQKLQRDPRVTPLGRFLRLSSIDELPQLINVFRGEMSLVGPRPIVAGERSRYGRHFNHYCMVEPGITGLWQVSGRNDTTYARRVALDVAYSRRVSFRLDMYILLKTIPAVLRADGCY